MDTTHATALRELVDAGYETGTLGEEERLAEAAKAILVNAEKFDLDTDDTALEAEAYAASLITDILVTVNRMGIDAGLCLSTAIGHVSDLDVHDDPDTTWKQIKKWVS